MSKKTSCCRCEEYLQKGEAVASNKAVREYPIEIEQGEYLCQKCLEDELFEIKHQSAQDHAESMED